MMVANHIEMKERDQAFLSFCQSLEHDILTVDNSDQDQFVIVLQDEPDSRNVNEDGNNKKKANKRNQNQNQNQNQRGRQQQQRMVMHVNDHDISLEEIANRIQVDYFSRYVKNRILYESHP